MTSSSTKHGITAYRQGCRCDTCRAAVALRWNRYQVDLSRRGGPLSLDPTTTREQLADIRNAVGSWSRVANLLGVSRQAVWHLATQRKKVRHSTAEAIAALWDDYCAPIRADRRRWPAEPIYRRVVSLYGSVKSSPWRRDVTRIRAKGSVSTETAEKWADRLGKMPHELWPDWFTADLEDAG